ncbi:hypothetical protein BB8028_0004g02040 [Beauveria bassiana]|uniref:RRM domain-containing protein n=1 Tax=Beauveria bassiana TaxID=176275 RepID=A0A2S7YBF2_BEABA|nr:hypothetical protein BB8028_0004g02040 [Beauveria bassiana]
MSFFDKGVDGALPAGSSDSSGDATRRPKSPISQVIPRIGRPTPSFQFPRLGSNAVHHGEGGALSQLNLRRIWEDANRPTQQHQQPQQQQQYHTSTMPHAVFPDSLNSFNDGSTSTHRRMAAAPHGQALGAYVGPDVRDSDAGLERPAHFSIWSPYGAQTAHDNNNNNNSSVRDGGIAPTLSPYSAYFAAPPSSARADAGPNRPHSEAVFSASTELSMAQRPLTSHLAPIIPIRMGQSPGRAPGSRIASGADAHQPPVPFCFQPRSQRFLPMQAIRPNRGTFASSSESASPWAPSVSVANPVPSTRFSDRYHGMHTESNASAEHLTPEQNTSLWITNLPPDTTHHELLGQIRNMGRVWCCFINGPDGCKHTTAAAKVVFFRPSAARRLLQHAAAPDGGLHIRGFRAKVTHNRIKTGETEPRGDESRVLIVTGHKDYVNEATLTEWFADRFVFQLDEVRQLVKDEESCLAVVEFRFGSYRCQAQMGKMSLEKEREWWFERAEFGEDPCEVGETYSAYAVASQRIEEVKQSRQERQQKEAEQEARLALERLALERSYRRQTNDDIRD